LQRRRFLAEWWPKRALFDVPARDRTENFFNILNETHAEHFIRFIKDYPLSHYPGRVPACLSGPLTARVYL